MTSLNGSQNKKIFCLITGASRGFGKALAETLVPLVGKGSNVLLASRDIHLLNGVKKILKDLKSDIDISVSRMNLESISAEMFESFLKQFQLDTFTEAILINNAGSLGDLSKASSHESESELNSYFHFNISSFIILTSVFLRMTSTLPRKTVVNVSSKAGLEAFKGFSLYCAGKAARDLYYKVLAIEEPDVYVLNYAPGPMHTDMMLQLLKESDSEINGWAKELDAKSGFVDTTESANKMWKIVFSQCCKSGSHVDFFDDL